MATLEAGFMNEKMESTLKPSNGEPKKKPRRKKPPEVGALDAVRASIEKPKDHELEEMNTFNPEKHDKSEVKGQRKPRKMAEAAAVDDEDDQVVQKKVDNRKRQVISPVSFNGEDHPIVKPRGKKKKPKGDGQSNPSFEMEELTSNGRPKKINRRKNLEATVENEQTEPLAAERPVVKKRVKKKKLIPQESQEELIPNDENPNEEATPRTEATNENEMGQNMNDEGQVTKVVIHRTDRLKTELVISHPIVRIHVMDMNTGKYLKKQKRERNVTFYYEDPERIDYIQPIMTKPWDFKKFGSSIPMWEEQIIFNENYNYIKNNADVIIFFEVLDFLRANNVSNNYRFGHSDCGWHRIAWAFLKPCPPHLPVNGSNKNVDHKIRLQLYEPGIVKDCEPDTAIVFTWWQATAAMEDPTRPSHIISPSRRVPYPSTLYVSIQGMRLTQPEDMQPDLRSLYPNQKEIGSTQPWDPFSQKDQGFGAIGDFQLPIHWNRLPGQMCRIPNRPGLALPSGQFGCTVIKFSPNGRLLACATLDSNSDFPIIIYAFPKATESAKLTLRGHSNMVYDLSWSRKGHYLASASSDCTVRVWTVINSSTPTTQLLSDTRENSTLVSVSKAQSLAHPCFVYSAQFHPRISSLLATGAYDRVVRIWFVERSVVKILQEITGHSAFINCVRFHLDGKELFSADSDGVIFVWKCFVTEEQGRDPFVQNWTKVKSINEKELQGVAINHLEVHPSGKKILVHSRDNTIRMLDLRLWCICQRFRGALCYKKMIRSCITPCGTFVITGSEDDRIYIWNSETGDRVAYYEANLNGVICTIDYHPFDHSMAFSAFVQNAPVLIYAFDEAATMKETLAHTGGSNSPRSGASSPVLDFDAMEKANFNKSSRYNDLMSKQESMLHSLRHDREIHDRRRIEEAMNKLNTVLQTSQMLRSSISHNNGKPMSSTMGTSGYVGTELSLSPRLTAKDQAHQIKANQEYLAESRKNWRPDFVPVIGGLSKRRGQSLNRTSAGESKQATSEMMNDVPQEDIVISLYDYAAERSDELSFKRGEKIRILDRETPNWWVGQLENGDQGYVPTAYVIGENNPMQKVSNESKESVKEKEKDSNDELESQRESYLNLLKDSPELNVTMMGDSLVPPPDDKREKNGQSEKPRRSSVNSSSSQRRSSLKNGKKKKEKLAENEKIPTNDDLPPRRPRQLH